MHTILVTFTIIMYYDEILDLTRPILIIFSDLESSHIDCICIYVAHLLRCICGHLTIH
jgi:hypothetical protein